MPDSTAPGRSLRVLREMAGMTLDQVADAAGVTAAYLSKVETGKAIPSRRWIATVSAVIADGLKAGSAA